MNDLGLRIAEWLESGGEAEIEQCLEDAKKAQKAYRDAARVDYRTLDKPCTI